MKILICSCKLEDGMALNESEFIELSKQYDVVVNEKIWVHPFEGTNERICNIIGSSEKIMRFRMALERADLPFGDLDPNDVALDTKIFKMRKIGMMVYASAEIIALVFKNTDTEVLYHK